MTGSGGGGELRRNHEAYNIKLLITLLIKIKLLRRSVGSGIMSDCVSDTSCDIYHEPC